MSPATLTTTLLLTQFVLLLIVYFGILALSAGERKLSVYSSALRATSRLPSMVLGFSLLTLACLVFSRDFVLLSQPMFGDVPFPAWSREVAFFAVFALDILGAGFLVAITGGMKGSPFSAVLFALPALSIFLRETPLRFAIYTGLVALLFLSFSGSNPWSAGVLENPKHVLALRLVTLGCLALSSLVGYATRPV